MSALLGIVIVSIIIVLLASSAEKSNKTPSTSNRSTDINRTHSDDSTERDNDTLQER